MPIESKFPDVPIPSEQGWMKVSEYGEFDWIDPSDRRKFVVVNGEKWKWTGTIWEPAKTVI